MASEQAVAAAGGESMGMPGQPAMGFGFAALPPAMGASPEQSMVSPLMRHGMNGVGHLYLQTHEVLNCVIRYQRPADGTLTEGERRYTEELDVLR